MEASHSKLKEKIQGTKDKKEKIRLYRRWFKLERLIKHLKGMVKR